MRAALFFRAALAAGGHDGAQRHRDFAGAATAGFPRLAPQLERTVFRIVQEALTNVLRHSRAQKASVTLMQKENSLLLSVRDDGKGVGEQTLQLQPGSIGIGLGGMRERVREFGGELRIVNANPGTIIEVSIPAAIPASHLSLATA